MERIRTRVGRPTMCTPELIQKAWDYVTHEFGPVYADVVPSIAGLACALGVGRRSMYDWEEANPEFSYILTAIKEKQEKMLLNGGLSGANNAQITKLMLGKHGYHDSVKTDLDVSTSKGAISITAIELTGPSV